jgi:hypothetical protein
VIPSERDSRYSIVSLFDSQLETLIGRFHWTPITVTVLETLLMQRVALSDDLLMEQFILQLEENVAKFSGNAKFANLMLLLAKYPREQIERHRETLIRTIQKLDNIGIKTAALMVLEQNQ